MKTVKGILSLARILVFALSLAGCAGIIPPAIGESAMSAEADTQAQDAQPAEGGGDAQPAEGGFTGTSYTDAGGTIDGYMNTDYGLHTLGTDVCLLPNQSPEATLKSCLRDKSSAATVYCLQDAAHRRLYNMVNSNAVIGLTPGTEVSYGEAPWQTGLKIGWAVVAILEIACAAAIFSMWRKKED